VVVAVVVGKPGEGKKGWGAKEELNALLMVLLALEVGIKLIRPRPL